MWNIESGVEKSVRFEGTLGGVCVGVSEPGEQDARHMLAVTKPAPDRVSRHRSGGLGADGMREGQDAVIEVFGEAGPEKWP